MRTRDPHDATCALITIVADAIAVFASVLLAAWMRFDSGWFDVPLGRDVGLWFMRVLGNDVTLYDTYKFAGVFAILVNYVVMRSIRLYSRPQRGTFPDKLPRLYRAILTDVVVYLVTVAIFKNQAEYSNFVIGLFAPCAVILITFERCLLFKFEIWFARRSEPSNVVLIVGTDSMATRIANAFHHDPRLRVKVAGLLTSGDASALDPSVTPDMILGDQSDIEKLIESSSGRVTQLIVTDQSSLSHRRLEEIVTLCARNMVRFNIVPDMFRMMTSRMEVETISDIPLLGFGHMPLDSAWNRVLKRLEDIVGSLAGLIISFPVMLVFGLLHRRQSPGSLLYRQERCGQGGKTFTMYKLRTMVEDAEAESGPVWASPDDPRRTRLGAWMRSHNIDELPQFWNVLKGDMSLVGPRPERPVFVEQFRGDMKRYMWRHTCRPGITGWAQVNGYRGDTSIEERLRCDLYYLEHWSLAFDLKILIRTVFAVRNAY